LAKFTSESRTVAAALEIVKKVGTFTTVARVVFAFIDLVLADLTGVARGTGARKVL